MSRADEQDIIGTKPVRDETAGLGLFAAASKPSLAMPGAGQAARREAREKAESSRFAKYRLIARVLEAHGPCTRSELALLTGLQKDTVNGRVSEMRTAPDVPDELRVVTSGRRDGESVCHLARLDSARAAG